MAAVAENIIRPQRHRISVEDYRRMGGAGIFLPTDRVELINGEIIDRPPAGSFHAGIVNHLSHVLGAHSNRQAIVSVQNPVNISEYSEPEPDIALLKYRDDFYVQAHPTPQDVLLAIEVADTSVRYDREVKMPVYAGYGIPEFWLVDIPGKRLLCFSQPLQQEGRYRAMLEADLSQPVPIQQLAGVALPLQNLFANL